MKTTIKNTIAFYREINIKYLLFYKLKNPRDLNELYSSGGGNPDLEPEESLSYELGFNQKLEEREYGNTLSITDIFQVSFDIQVF